MPPKPPGWRQRLAPGALLRALLARRGSIAAPLGKGWERELAMLRETRGKVPLLLSDAAALQIQIAVRAARNLDGAMAEAGVLMGGSARLICDAKGDAPLHLFDAFDTPSVAGDTELRSHFGSVHGKLADVRALLAPYAQVHFHPGVFPESALGLEELRFSFVHLDMDLVSSTDAALDFFHPRIVPGGILIGDDYQDAGVRGCFARYFAGRADTLIELPWGQVMVVCASAGSIGFEQIPSSP